MTVQEMLVELDDHGYTDLSWNRKLGALNASYFDICTREAWPFLETEVNTSLPAGADSLSMPTDWAQTSNLTLYETTLTNGVKLHWIRQDEIQARFPDDTTSVPFYYYFIGERIFVFPEADKDYTVSHAYLRRPVKMSPDTLEPAILLPPAHHELITLGALARLYAMDGLTGQAKAMSELFTDRFKSMRNELWQRQSDRPDNILMLDPEDYDYYNAEIL